MCRRRRRAGSSGRRRFHFARLDEARAVRLRRPALSRALCQSVAAADPEAASADLDSRLALARHAGGDRQARILLFPVLAQPRQGDRALAAAFAKFSKSTATAISPSRMGILMSAYVAETDAQAQAEAKEGVWYFLKNCLKGHLRREGRQLTFGPGIPYIPPEEFRSFLQFSDPTTPLLGDAENWDDLQQSRSIIVGSPDTVYRRIMDILDARQGRPSADPVPPRQHGRTQLTRKSMRLFATEVAPRLRADSATLFGANFPDMERSAPEMATVSVCWTCSGRKVAVLEAGHGEPLVYLHGFADVHGVAGDLSRSISGWRSSARDRAGSSGLRRIATSSRRLQHRRRDLPLSRSCSMRSGLPRFDLVGHCVGGWIAAELAVRHPERVRG